MPMSTSLNANGRVNDENKNGALHSLLHQLQSETKVFETPKGRRFVFRPLRSSDLPFEVPPRDCFSQSYTARRPQHSQQQQQQQHQPKAIQELLNCGVKHVQSRKSSSSSGAVASNIRPNSHHPRQQPLSSSAMSGVFRTPEIASIESPLMSLFKSSAANASGGVGSSGRAAAGHSISISDLLGMKRRSTATAPSPVTAVSATFKHAEATTIPPSLDLREKGQGIQWLFDAAKREKTTRVDVEGPLSPTVEALLSRTKTELNSPQHNMLWDFSSPEDAVDEDFLFRRDELQRRKNPRYLARTKKLYDLHIVLPITVPNGTIVVDDTHGANYYKFDNTKYVGAHILFGKGVASADNPGEEGKTSQYAAVSSHEEPSSKHANDTENQPENEMGKTIKESRLKAFSCVDLKRMNPACDVWASFLHIRLGTLYNLNEEQMTQVVDRFKSAFDQNLCYFYVPISIDCRGLYPSTDDMISQRAGRPHRMPKEGVAPPTSERYETRGTPTTENDVKRLRMLKRYLKRFAMGLITDLGFNRAPAPSLLLTQQQQTIVDHMLLPRPCIELHDNCRTSTLMKGSLKIVVREWSRLDDPEIFKKVWNGRLASSALHHGVADTVWTKLLEDKDIPSARALLGEIRLEHNHLRMVDPRWRDELVLGRRIADYYPHLETPAPDNAAARFVFCSRIRKPKVVYTYVKEGEDPRVAALNSRLAALYKVHLVRYPHLSVEATGEGGITSERTKTNGATIVPKEEGQTETTATTEEAEQCTPPPPPPPPPPPNGGVSKKGGSTEPGSSERLVHDNHGAARSDAQHLSTAVCKFFLSGGCARAEKCFFLHPADPSLESKVDVRHIMPKHPKYF